MENLPVVLVLSLFLHLISISNSTKHHHPVTECKPPEFSVSEALKGLERGVNDEKEILAFCEKHYNRESLQPTEKPDDGITTKKNCKIESCSNCADYFLSGETRSGVYTVKMRFASRTKRFSVYCDMTTDGGGWTVIQRRGDFGIPINFWRDWIDYTNGFGDLREEFWLGNEYNHLLTEQDDFDLRIDLGDHENNYRYALYDGFEVSNSNNDYTLKIGKLIDGNLSDSLTYHSGAKFQTLNHEDNHKCATKYKGGWWYKNANCYTSNLNGIYSKGTSKSDWTGFNWGSWHGYTYSLKWGEMKIRPKSLKQSEREL